VTALQLKAERERLDPEKMNTDEHIRFPARILGG
jgi:hypothetical protein